MSEEKKKDALADALAALAAGEHHEEPSEGSGMEGHIADEPAAPAPAPVAPRRPAPPAPRAGGPPQPVTRTGAPTPRRAGPPTPAQATERTPPAPPAKPRSTAPAPTTSRPAPVTPPRPAPPRGDAPMRPASPNSKVRPSMPGQAVPRTIAPQARSTPAAPPSPPAAKPVAPPPAKPVAPPAAAAKIVAPPPPPVEPPPPPVEEVFVEPVIEEPAQPLSPVEQAAMHEAEVAAEAEAMTHIVEDDDTLNLPAPPPEALATRRAPRRPQRELASRTIGFKQTMIPILLTMGVLLSGIAGWSFALGEESPVVDAPIIPICVMALGILMLAFAVVTMLQVKAQLRRQTQEEAG